jgi:hypothetical protein
METFVDTDAGCLRWVDHNRDGFVLDTYRRPTADYLSRRASPRMVMDLRGHSQIAVTMNTYGHVIPAMQQEAAGHVGTPRSATRDNDEPGGSGGGE